MSSARVRRDVPEFTIKKYFEFFSGNRMTVTLPSKHSLKMGDILHCLAGVIESACEVVSVSPTNDFDKVKVVVKRIVVSR